MTSVHVVVRALYIIRFRLWCVNIEAFFIYNKVYGVYVENARDVEIDDLRVQVGPKVNYGGKIFGIDD